MVRLLAKSVVIALLIFFLSGTANAGLITSRAALQTLLGGPGTVEDFENYEIGNGTYNSLFNCDTGNSLNASVSCEGQGPGLVDPGIQLHAVNILTWYGADWYGSPSREIAGDWSPLTLEFTSPVFAFGLDLRAWEGFGATAMIDIFAADKITLIGSIANINLASDGLAVFAGWADSGGIGLVQLSQTLDQYPLSPSIDNVEWGSPSVVVSAPATVPLLALGLAAVGLSRRKIKINA